MNSTPDMKRPDAPADTAPTPAVQAQAAQAESKNQAPTQPQTKARPAIKWLGMTMPGEISDTVNDIRDFGARARQNTIRSLPAAVVNRSSNVIAATQLVGEALMMKANGTEFVPKERYKNVFSYITDPPRSIFNSVFQKAGGGNDKITDIFKTSFYSKDGLKAATARDLGPLKDIKLINRWQARSTFAGLSGMLIAALLPDVKDTPEDLEKRAAMSYNNPVGYTLKSIGEGLWFPVGTVLELGKRGIASLSGKPMPESDIGKYKRQFTGLAITVAGLCSFLSGFRNVPMTESAKKLVDAGQISKKALKPKDFEYGINTAHSIGGMITAVAGSQLLTSIGSDQGWSRFGSIQWLRMLFLPSSIGKRYQSGEQGRHYYALGQAALQTTNTMSYLIGGAEKNEDGTIVDHKSERVKVKEKVREESRERKAQRHENREEAPETLDGEFQDIPKLHVSGEKYHDKVVHKHDALSASAV